MAEERIDLFEGLHKAVASAAPDLLRQLPLAMVTQLMGAEVDALCGAAYGERSPERANAPAMGTERGRGTPGSARYEKPIRRRRDSYGTPRRPRRRASHVAGTR
jgi:transposase-like protein